MRSPRNRRSWASAAAQASFSWFTPIQPQPLHTWAGGFGWDPTGPTTLAVMAECDGVEVSVETRVVDDCWTDGAGQRMMVHESVWRAVVGGVGPLSLPMTIVLEPDDRTIVVDGREVTFAGVRLAGSDRWTGMAKVGNVSVKIVTDASVPNLALRSSTDTSLSEHPPT
jgi:hypothetical protein